MPLSPADPTPARGRPSGRAVLVVLALLLLGVALAGCGGSTKVVTDATSTGSADTGTSATATGATSPDPATVASTPSTTTTTARTPPAKTKTTGTGTTPAKAPDTGGASPVSTSTGPGSATGTTPSAAPPYEASCGDTFEDVSGLSCAHADPVMNAWNDSSSCEISDQYGSPSSSTCTAEGYTCSAHLGYRPGQTEGEESAIVACRESGASLSFIRGT